MQTAQNRRGGSGLERRSFSVADNAGHIEAPPVLLGNAAGERGKIDYQIAKKESFDHLVNDVRIHRIQFRVSLPEHSSEATVRRTAERIVKDVTSSDKVNGISLLFYGPNASIDGSYTVASVKWAPNGNWADAAAVAAGDYRRFLYAVKYIQRPSESASTLSKSGKTGLFNIPLPVGARLIESVPARPPQHDAKARYSFSASAADIIAFFDREMAQAGWLLTGPSSESGRYFKKGRIEVLILVNGRDGSFTLMGS